MPWKMKDNAIEVGSDGNPVWIDTAGKESTVSGDTITRLNGEARDHRKRAEDAEKALKAFEGIEPTAAREAIAKLATVDLSKMVEAGKVEEVRAAITADFQKRLDAKDIELKTMSDNVRNSAIQSAFMGSKFVTEKLTLAPADVQALFGGRFDVRDGKVVALDANKQPVTSAKNMGEFATFDEAIEMVVMQHPTKETLLRGANNSGTGNNGGGGYNGVKRTATRADERAMSHADRAAFMKEVREGKAELVD